MGTDLPEQFLEGLPDAVLILGPDGVAEHVNGEAIAWFGPDLVGKLVGVPLGGLRRRAGTGTGTTPLR